MGTKRKPRLEIVSGDHRIVFSVSDNGDPYLSHFDGDRNTGTPLGKSDILQIRKWITAVLSEKE